MNLSIESVTNINDDTNVYGTSVMQPHVCYPSIRLAQPRVPDETGVMKFRYQVRLTTQLELLMHLLDDFDLAHGSGNYPANSSLQQGRVAFNNPSIEFKGTDLGAYWCVGWQQTK